MEEVKIRLREDGEKNAVLTCNWCKQPHPVEQSYMDDILKRGAEKIEELELISSPTSPPWADLDLVPEDTWTCGKCLLYLTGLPAGAARTGCHDHDVPRREDWRPGHE